MEIGCGARNLWDNHFQLSISHSNIEALNMPEIPPGFSLDAADGCYILRHKTAEGVISEIKMLAADLHGLKASIDLRSDRKISEYQVEPGSGFQPIVVYPIALLRLLPDAPQTNVLLTVAAPSGEQMTLSFPLPVADRIAVELPELLARMRAANPRKVHGFSGSQGAKGSRGSLD
jgi:hypothetical protein